MNYNRNFKRNYFFFSKKKIYIYIYASKYIHNYFIHHILYSLLIYNFNNWILSYLLLLYLKIIKKKIHI